MVSQIERRDIADWFAVALAEGGLMRTQQLTNIDHKLVTVNAYPVLAALASRVTSATRLDGRACRYIYYSGLSTIDPSMVHPEEIAFMRGLGVYHPGHASLVVVTSEGEDLVARLSGGRELRHEDAEALADLLLAAGVTANDVRMPDWRAGDIAPCTGHKIAILGRMNTQSKKQVGDMQ